jgi:DNA-binding transcriptional LysR family regulator
MLSGISLDHLRTFVVAAEDGSFSAAARRLRRVQSAISHSIGKLEARMGIELFDRSARQPTLTAAGAVLLEDARAVISGVDEMKTRADVLAAGVEPELSVAVDGAFPMEALAQATSTVRLRCPAVAIRLAVEGTGGAYKSVLEGQRQLGIVGALRPLPSGLMGEHLMTASLLPVASPDHPLARLSGSITRRQLDKHTQIVLATKSGESACRQLGVTSPSMWEAADPAASRALILEGLGWGNLPAYSITSELAEGRLKVLSIAELPPKGLPVGVSIVYRPSAPPGQAGRAFIEQLRDYFEQTREPAVTQ